MKKLLVILASLALAFGVSSCNSCSKPAEESVEPSIVVENCISMDREYMTLNYGGDYKWYESCVIYDNYLDADTTIAVAGVSNIFQIVTARGEESFDTKVISIAHVGNASSKEVKEMAFWVGDKPLNDEEIALTFEDAFERLMEANCPKPHSKYVVLRRELGPLPNVNAQYVFGNLQSQVYVDAVTGDVKLNNPAFPEDFTYSFTW
ncbi:MAG: hypothetical protein J6T10_13230 [Methanobrevibacter sp.]|nr:hypothetical protein [Methanobrevibacter sp.]